jgi:hypothetical protein
MKSQSEINDEIDELGRILRIRRSELISELSEKIDSLRREYYIQVDKIRSDGESV